MNENKATSAERRNNYDGLKEISRLLSKVDDEDFIWEFFECLFTESERRDFSNRWLLVKEIASGMPQREISQKFGLSLCKITRGSKELKKPDSAFLRMLRLLESQN